MSERWQEPRGFVLLRSTNGHGKRARLRPVLVAIAFVCFGTWLDLGPLEPGPAAHADAPVTLSRER